MTSQTLERVYVRGIKLLLFIVPFLSLLITRSMFFPFITGRNFVFRILIEVALIFWLGLIVAKKEYRPKLSFVSGALLVFLIVVGIADATGIFSFKAFWSNYERMEGFITLLHLGAYFVMLSSVFRSKKEWLQFLNVFVLAGTLVALYGLFQKLGWVEVIQPGFRIRPVSTIGNASYLAAYLILTSTLALYLLFERESFGMHKYRKFFNYAYVAVVVLSLIIVSITGTRGAFVGILAGALLFPVIYLWLVRRDKTVSKRIKTAMLVVIILAILIPTALLAFKNTEPVKNSPLLSRYASISFEEGRSRFLIWNMALQGFKERPILGWGQEGFLYVFSKNYNPGMFDQEPWFDRAHNIVLDWMINAGILGILSYLSLLGGTIYVLNKIRKRGVIPRKGLIIIVVGLFAYFIQNLFVFDNLNTYLAFFTILAFTHGLSVKSEPQEGKEVKPSRILGASVVALLIIVPVVYSANIKPVRQSLGLIDALSTVGAQTQDGLRALPLSGEIAKETKEKFQRALDYNTFGYGETIEQIGQAAMSLLNNPAALQQEHLELIAMAISELEEYLERFPEDVRMRLFTATIYNRAIPLNPEFGERGLMHIEQVLEVNPDRQLALFILAENYLARNDIENTLVTAKRAVELAPEFEEAQATYGQFAVLVRDNEVVQSIVNENDQSAIVLERIGQTFINIGDFDRAVVIFEGLVQRFPENPDFVARLADAYLQLGRFDEAIAAAQFSAQQDPVRYGARAQAFIDIIEKERENANQ